MPGQQANSLPHVSHHGPMNMHLPEHLACLPHMMSWLPVLIFQPQHKRAVYMPLTALQIQNRALTWWKPAIKEVRRPCRGNWQYSSYRAG